MSEVIFYQFSGFEGESYVKSTQFFETLSCLDRVTAERDAALGREAAHLAVINRFEKLGCTTCDGSGHLHRIDGEYMGHCESYLAYEHERLTRERDALQQRLTAADERAGELLIMLRMAWVDTEVSAENCRRIDAALNPTAEDASHEAI